MTIEHIGQQGTICTMCGQATQAGWDFCQGCGTALTTPLSTATGPQSLSPQATALADNVVPYDSQSSRPESVPPLATAERAVVPAPLFNSWNRETPQTVPVPVGPAYPTSAPGAAAAIAAVPPDPSPRRVWVRRHRASLAVLLVLLGIVAAFAVNDSGAHGQLSATRHHLSQTTATLHSTQSSLASTQSQLTSTQAALSAANTDKANLQSQLSSTEQQLTGVRSTLSDTQNQLNLQSGQLSILKTCLSGVETSFSAVLNGDYSAALAAIDSVQSACQSANKLVNG